MANKGMCSCDTRYTGETVYERVIQVNGKPAGMLRTCCFCGIHQLIVFGQPGDKELFDEGKKTLGEIAPWAERIRNERLFSLFDRSIVVLAAPATVKENLDAKEENRDKPKEEKPKDDTEEKGEADSVQRTYSEEPYIPAKGRGRKKKE